MAHSTGRHVIELQAGKNFFDWANEQSPAPRFSVQLDPWQLRQGSHRSSGIVTDSGRGNPEGPLSGTERDPPSIAVQRRRPPPPPRAFLRSHNHLRVRNSIRRVSIRDNSFRVKEVLPMTARAHARKGGPTGYEKRAASDESTRALHPPSRTTNAPAIKAEAFADPWAPGRPSFHNLLVRPADYQCMRAYVRADLVFKRPAARVKSAISGVSILRRARKATRAYRCPRVRAHGGPRPAPKAGRGPHYYAPRICASSMTPTH